MQGGWIKINREIVNHWLWQDAERLKWWLDLLFLANWDDKKVLHDSHLFTLKRGQIIASISFLSERWGKSNPTIIKYLKLLEDEGMIYRQVLYRQTPIITICNYEKYQTQEAAQVDTLLDRQVDSIVDTQVDRNKESKEYIIHNNARTREESFLSELENSVFYTEGMAMRYHIGTDEVREALQVFAKECSLKDTEHRTLTDYKRHFHDWLRYQVEKKTKQNDNGDDYRRAQQSNREQRARETEAAIDALLRAGARRT